MRRGILVGSAIAVLLLGGAAGLALYGMRTGSGTVSPPMAVLSQDDASLGNSQTAGPTPAAPATAPSFDIVKVGPTGTAVIAGRAAPGSKVTVRDGDKVIGEVTADRRGEWVLVPEQPLGRGDRLLSLEASDPQGAGAVKSDETVALSIGPSAPGGKGETALAVLLPRDGSGAARVLQHPDREAAANPDAPAPGKGDMPSIETVEYGAHGRVLLSGHAAPGATVQIYIGNAAIATATADAAGGWSAASTRAIAPGSLELRVDQLGEDGRVARRVTLPLPRASTAQLAAGEEYTVQPGNSLWQIARRTYGNGVRYLIIYSANLGQIHDPQRIYPGQVFKLPKS